MLEKESPLTQLRASLAAGRLTPQHVAEKAITLANSNASHNTYLHFRPDEVLLNAAVLDKAKPLFSVPISLKDCFDLAGTRTTCGSRFYAGHQPVAAKNSAVAQSILDSGALLTGKTHLHPLAYGITGQNPEYGDCLQARDATLLTGGSSSGAVASVQEGSALAAIGTDTGGSIRVPAALCGLTGFRASHSLASTDACFPQAWAGAAHLAPSFDTLGILLHDPRDLAPIAETLFHLPAGPIPAELKVGYVGNSFLDDCEEDVLSSYRGWKKVVTAAGATLREFDTAWWADTLEIFAGLQAHEAAHIHEGHFHHFEASIRRRLEWGASLTPAALANLRKRLAQFQLKMDKLLDHFDLLMLPAAPVSRLYAHADLTDARRIILRYTTPFSLAGLPALSLPGEIIAAPFGTGVQIAAAPGADPMLLAFAQHIGDHLAA